MDGSVGETSIVIAYSLLTSGPIAKRVHGKELQIGQHNCWA